tara:strand:- start:1206 stop:1343 length:138 start_codon:yes stop_codon:yes gene_type:complete
MAINVKDRLFKTHQGARRWVYAPLMFYGGVKTLVYIKNNYKIEKK